MAVVCITMLLPLQKATAVQDGVVELQIGQGINGAVLGAAFTAGSRNWILGVPLTVLTATAGAMYPAEIGRSNKITPPSSHLVNFMSLWGITTGLAFGGWSDSGFRSLAWSVFWLDLASTISANLLLTGHYSNITNGQTGQIISGWLYGIGLAGLIASSPLYPDVKDSHLAGLLFWGQIAGLAGGFAFAETFDMSRKRVLLLDVSLLAGFGGGYGLIALFSHSQNLRWFGGVIGMGLTATVAMLSTTHWPDEGRDSSTKASGGNQFNFSLPPLRTSF